MAALDNTPLNPGGPYPLEVILKAFADYLRCIPKHVRFDNAIGVPAYGIHWVLLKRVPLNAYAQMEGKLRVLTDTSYGLQAREWSEFPPGAIGLILFTACRYLEYLRNRTKRFSRLPLEQIPVKEVRDRHSLIAGTAGSRTFFVFDVAKLARDAGAEGPAASYHPATPVGFNTVFTDDDADAFFELLDPYNRSLDRLLFSVLRYFGLRPGEAAALQLDPTSLPRDLTNYHAARDLLQNLRGDIQFVQESGLAGTWVITTGWKTPASHRVVPLITHRMPAEAGSHPARRFPTQEEFTDLLYWALVQRQERLQGIRHDHGGLFVSGSNRARGRAIDRKTVYRLFGRYAEALYGQSQEHTDLRAYSPHTFRHLFATVLLRHYRRPLEDVRQWLGHSSVAVTRNTYIHWLPEAGDNPQRGLVVHMADTYEQQSQASQRVVDEDSR